jgi:hypothetical protein
VDDIQASCYKILDSLYMVTGLTGTYSQRKNIHMEVEKHRAALGQCLGAFAACFPVAFLESEFNQNNKLSVLAKTRDQSVQVQEMLQTLSQHIPQLDKLLMDIEQAAEKWSFSIKVHELLEQLLHFQPSLHGNAEHFRRRPPAVVLLFDLLVAVRSRWVKPTRLADHPSDQRSHQPIFLLTSPADAAPYWT